MFVRLIAVVLAYGVVIPSQAALRGRDLSGRGVTKLRLIERMNQFLIHLTMGLSTISALLVASISLLRQSHKAWSDLSGSTAVSTTRSPTHGVVTKAVSAR
jgi:hypothetical protein